MSHKDGNMQETDIMTVQTMDGFCEILQIKDDSNTYDTLGDSMCFDTIWTNQPQILDAPVLNPEEQATDAGYNIHLGDDPCSMRDVLSELMGVPKDTYKGLIQWWFHQHMFDHQISKAWWYPRKLNWSVYQAKLGSDMDADSLEILAASAAMRMHINILQDKKIWNSRCNNFSEKDMTILWSEHGAQLCDWPEPCHERWETSAESSLKMDTLEMVYQVIKVLGGQPRVHDKKSDLPEVHDSSESGSDSEIDTDLHKLYVMKQRSS